MFSPKIRKLIELFSKFPTVGQRTATRFVFYLMNISKKETEEIIKSIKELKAGINVCPLCFRFFEGEKKDICSLCSDKRRDKSTICLVEKQTDLEAIEKTGKYKGMYFILKEKNLKNLINRIKKEKIKEIILALDPTTKGEKTSLWLKRKLKDLPVKVSQLAIGLPVGGEIEYADEDTLLSALERRK